MAYEYDNVEPGFSITRPRASGVHIQSHVDPLILATVEGDQGGASRSLSSFSFSSPISGDLLHIYSFFYLDFL
jgi:hypothetical protein